MVDENYLAVLRDELAHVYAENIALKAALAGADFSRDAAYENIMYFLDSVNPERIERRVLDGDLATPIGESFVEVLKEVARAELGASSLTN